MKISANVFASLLLLWAICLPGSDLAAQARDPAAGSPAVERSTSPPPATPPATAPAAEAPAAVKPPNVYARIAQIAAAPAEWPTITLYVSVFDLQGRPIKGLEVGDFMVDEQGTATKPLSAKPFADVDTGTGIVLVLDASGSMRGQPFREAKRGVNSFLSLLGPKDRAALMVLHDEVRLDAPFTEKIDDVKAKVDEIEATAKITLLYDGLAKALDEIVARSSVIPTRKAIIVMSDGRDEGSTKKL